MRWLVVWVGCGLALGCQVRDEGSAPAGEDLRPGLVLEEQRAWPLPSVIGWVGGFVRKDESVLIWSWDGRVDFFPAHSLGPETFPEGRVDLLVTDDGSLPPSNAMLGVSRRDGRLVDVFAADSVVARSGPCDAFRRTSAVLATNGGFLVLGREREPVTGGTSVTFVRLDGFGCHTLATVSLACPPRSVSLAPAKEPWYGLAACSDPEMPLLGVSLRGGRLEIDELPGSVPPATFSRAPEGESHWFGLPILRIEDGYLRVVADLRSDTRRFERWSDSGRHMATTVAEGALGLMASDQAGGRVLGMRSRVKYHELVLFRVLAGT